MTQRPLPSAASCLILVSIIVGSSPQGSAQAPSLDGSSGIKVQGHAKVGKLPSVMRLTIVLSGRGKTLPESLERLRERVEAAKIQLAKFGADEANISTGPILRQSNQQQQQMEMMYRQQMRGRELPKGLMTPQSVTLTSELTAGWSIPSVPHAEVLAFAGKVQEQVKAADLAGLNEPQQLTPEEQELQAEMAQRMGSYGGEEERPGEPKFVYVARLTSEEIAKGKKSAFDDAATQAAELATAANKRRGPLRGLQGGSVTHEPIYNPYTGEVTGGDQHEAMVQEYKEAAFTINIEAVFAIAD